MGSSRRSFYLSLAIVMTLALFTTPASSQVTLQLGVGAGLAIPTSDYAGSTIDYYNGTKYGFKNALTFHAKARVGVIGLRIAAEADYTSFSNSGEAEAGRGSVDNKHKILSFKLGPEIMLGLPLMPITPYVGANISLNRFSGDVTFHGMTSVPSSTQELASTSRIGFGFTGGVLFKLGGFTTLDVSGAYDMLNSSGKTWEVAQASQDSRINSYTSLNDDKDPLYKAGDGKHFINKSRNINTLQIRATLMIGL